MKRMSKESLIEATHMQALDAMERMKRARTRLSKRTAEKVVVYFSSVYYELTGKEVSDDKV